MTAEPVLLVDTAFAAIPIHAWLVEAGFDVWVMGNRPGDVLAQKAGDRWIQQDYSQVDAVAAHVERLGVRHVVPGCTDVSIETCAALRLPTGRIDTPEATAALSNKDTFRGICRDLGLPAPRVIDAAELPRPGRHIAKPVDGYSGRGITVFDGADRAAGEAALATARGVSPSGEALVETFAEGQLHSYTCFIEGNRVVAAFQVCEGSSANPFAVDTSFVTGIPEPARAALQASVEAVSAHVGLVDGLVHTQFILDGDAVSIVEMSRRSPGDLYAMLIEYSTGFRYAAKYASYYVNRPFETRADDPRHILRHTVTETETSVYCGLRFRAPVPVKAFYPLQIMGETLKENQGSRAGLLFSEFPTRAALMEGYETFLARRAYDAG